MPAMRAPGRQVEMSCMGPNCASMRSSRVRAAGFKHPRPSFLARGLGVGVGCAACGVGTSSFRSGMATACGGIAASALGLRGLGRLARCLGALLLTGRPLALAPLATVAALVIVVVSIVVAIVVTLAVGAVPIVFVVRMRSGMGRCGEHTQRDADGRGQKPLVHVVSRSLLKFAWGAGRPSLDRRPSQLREQPHGFHPLARTSPRRPKPSLT